jgi:peptidoglycan hydrolase-like protein with peptidoglycan-binding domain
MGKKKGWCLQNCRLGYRIYTGHYASAKAAYQAGLKNGTVHSFNDLPHNCAVPVYYDTASQYGHVIVYDRGTYYSDGSKFNPDLKKCLGWDENMDSVPVVKKTSQKSFLPAKGYWAKYDEDDRVAVLARFMRQNFPAYTSAKALGPVYGNYLSKSIAEFQKRTGLYPDGMTGPKTYNKLKEYGFNY